ncbi:MAG TPA: ABC transporter permease [Atribacteraceae bacterium]|nr:ABC transporter permease [Atribacteraceae bacterium]
MAEMIDHSEPAKKNILVERFSEMFLYGKSMVPALLILLVGLVLFFGLLTPHFLEFHNFQAIISNIPVVAILSVGMTFVLLIGGLDLSVGSILGFTAVTAVLFHEVGFPTWLVFLGCLGIGAIFGSLNGFIIAKVGINPVITTLGMMAFARGLASWFSLEIEILRTGRIYDQNFLNIARLFIPQNPPLFPITLIYIIALFILASFVLRYTNYGRMIYQTGSNEYAARLAGINVQRIKFLSYMISGIMASLAGAILLAQLGLGRDDAGIGAELEVITAVVLGGVTLAGGKGSLSGVIIAILILGVIRNGMVHLETVTGISFHWREVVKGAILILAVSIDAARTIATRRKQVIRQ